MPLNQYLLVVMAIKFAREHGHGFVSASSLYNSSEYELVTYRLGNVNLFYATAIIAQKSVRKNCFSKHDNRHAFQTSGVYFGQVIIKCTISLYIPLEYQSKTISYTRGR